MNVVIPLWFTETTEAEYDTMFGINSKSAYFFLQEAGKKLNDNGVPSLLPCWLLIRAYILPTLVPRHLLNILPGRLPKSSDQEASRLLQ